MYYGPKDQLLPTKLELVFYVVVSLVIIIVANINNLASYFLNDLKLQGKDDLPLNIYITNSISYIEKLPFLPNSVVFVFWSIVGVVLYSLIQSLYGVFVEFRSDVNITNHFLHPKNFIKWQFWAEVVVQFLAHISLYALVILWGLLLWYVLIPSAALFAGQLFGGLGLVVILKFIGSFTLLFVGVLVFALILKIFFKRKQLIL